MVKIDSMAWLPKDKIKDISSLLSTFFNKESFPDDISRSAIYIPPLDLLVVEAI